jgi:hypothetical protein
LAECKIRTLEIIYSFTNRQIRFTPDVLPAEAAKVKSGKQNLGFSFERQEGAKFSV